MYRRQRRRCGRKVSGGPDGDFVLERMLEGGGDRDGEQRRQRRRRGRAAAEAERILSGERCEGRAGSDGDPVFFFFSIF